MSLATSQKHFQGDDVKLPSLWYIHKNSIFPFQISRAAGHWLLCLFLGSWGQQTVVNHFIVVDALKSWSVRLFHLLSPYVLKNLTHLELFWRKLQEAHGYLLVSQPAHPLCGPSSKEFCHSPTIKHTVITTFLNNIYNLVIIVISKEWREAPQVALH